MLPDREVGVGGTAVGVMEGKRGKLVNGELVILRQAQYKIVGG